MGLTLLLPNSEQVRLKSNLGIYGCFLKSMEKSWPRLVQKKFWIFETSLVGNHCHNKVPKIQLWSEMQTKTEAKP